MDPNVNLDECRDLARQLIDNENLSIETIELAQSLAERFQALDDWLAGGGFLPRAWQHKRKEP